MKSGSLLLILTGLVGLIGMSTAQANIVNGKLWAITDVAAQDATLANVPTTAPDVTFTSPSNLNFMSFGGGSNYEVGFFLAFDGATITNTPSPGALTRLLDVGDTGTMMELTGSIAVFHGESFTFTHDDGITLVIGGVPVITAPGPTFISPSSGVYTGPSGDLPFTLVYGECCGLPAELVGSLADAAAVPEPVPLAVFGASLISLGLLRRRKS